MATEIERSAACLEYEALLEDHVSGALKGGQNKAVKLHLEACANCRAAVEDAFESAQLLREFSGGAVWQVSPTPSFARLAMARIRASGADRVMERESFWQSFVFLGWRFAATAILALALLATYDVRSGRDLQPNVAPARPMVVRDILATDTGAAPASRDDVLVMVAGISDTGK